MELSSCAECWYGEDEVVNVFVSERYTRQLEEPFPPNSLNPITHTLALLSTLEPSMGDILRRLDGLRPSRWIVWKVGDC